MPVSESSANAVEVAGSGGLGLRVRARVLITGPDGRVLVVGRPGELPGGPLGDRESLIGAAREGVEKVVPVVALIGEPLLVTVDEANGLTVVFDGLRSAETLPPDAVEAGWGWAEAAAVPAAEEALAARAAGRIRYREALWWPIRLRGPGGSPPPSLGALLAGREQSNDVVEWVLGVILGGFATDSTFGSVRGIWWRGPDDPESGKVEALHRILMALAGAGIVNEHGEDEISWVERVDVPAVYRAATDVGLVGQRVHARLLITDADGRVLADGERPVLPGGSIGTGVDLAAAAAAEAYRASGVTARVGAPLAVTVTQHRGLTVIFEARVDDVGTARFVDPAGVHGALEAVAARADGRIRYLEELWWPIQAGRPGGLGPLLRTKTDDDVASWTLGVLLRAFPNDMGFTPFQGAWHGTDHPLYPIGAALHEVLIALARAGVLDEDGGTGFSWSSPVQVQSM